MTMPIAFLRGLALAALLASPTAAVAAETFDAAAEWERFLAEGATDAYDAYQVVNELDSGQGVDAARCREKADDLAKAAEALRVSARVQQVAYRCAEATGDDAAAETYRARFAALAAHALGQASDDWSAPPTMTHFGRLSRSNCSESIRRPSLSIAQTERRSWTSPR